MNFYAINVAPLNGYELQFAAGAGSIAVAGSGQFASVQKANSAVTIAMTAIGAAISGSLGRGDAAITMTMTGTTTSVQFGSGAGSIVMDGAGTGIIAITAGADATMAFGGRYDIADALPVPIAYHAAPLTRLMVKDADPRLIQVIPDKVAGSRTIRADRNLRLIHVSPEPILPVRETRTTAIQKERRQA